MQNADGLKRDVQAFWNRQSCDTQVARADKHSAAYFAEIERFRYRDQPFIHAFAQFTRGHGRKVLEIGVGAGTDFPSGCGPARARPGWTSRRRPSRTSGGASRWRAFRRRRPW